MSGCIVKVYFKPEADYRQGPNPFVLIETECVDFASFCDLVDANRLIGGANLWTRRGEVRGEMVITDRVPIAFRGEAVLRCELPTWTYVEAAA